MTGEAAGVGQRKAVALALGDHKAFSEKDKQLKNWPLKRQKRWMYVQVSGASMGRASRQERRRTMGNGKELIVTAAEHVGERRRQSWRRRQGPHWEGPWGSPGPLLLRATENTGCILANRGGKVAGLGERGHGMEENKTRERETSWGTFNDLSKRQRWSELSSALPHHIGAELRRPHCRMQETRKKKTKARISPSFPACTITWREFKERKATNKQSLWENVRGFVNKKNTWGLVHRIYYIYFAGSGLFLLLGFFLIFLLL